MNHGPVLIRLAKEEDAGSIVNLIQSSFDSGLINAMIYGCSGITKYVRKQILTPERLSDTKYLVVEGEFGIVACSEIKLASNSVFLNYICTHENRRGEGLGKLLLKEAVNEGLKYEKTRMELDVFNHNALVKEWYEKLGFALQYQTNWWKIPLKHDNLYPIALISGFPQAYTCKEEYGFSIFNAVSKKSNYSIGYLGDDWFRISQPEILDEIDVMNSLYLLDSTRSILGLFPDRSFIPTSRNQCPLCQSGRMYVDLNKLSKMLAR